jgi:hypothetical protein
VFNGTSGQGSGLQATDGSSPTAAEQKQGKGKAGKPKGKGAPEAKTIAQDAVVVARENPFLKAKEIKFDVSIKTMQGIIKALAEFQA